MWINGTQTDKSDNKSKDAFCKILVQNTPFIIQISEATPKVHQIPLP